MKRFGNIEDEAIKALRSGKKVDFNKVNRRLDAENRSLKSRMDNILKKGKNLGQPKAKVTKSFKPLNKMTGTKASSLLKPKTSLLGLGAVAGVAYLGGKEIVKARKGVEKVLDEQNANSKKGFENAKKLQKHLKEQKEKTGMSLKQRKKKSNFPYGL